MIIYENGLKQILQSPHQYSSSEEKQSLLVVPSLRVWRELDRISHSTVEAQKANFLLSLSGTIHEQSMLLIEAPPYEYECYSYWSVFLLATFLQLHIGNGRFMSDTLLVSLHGSSKWRNIATYETPLEIYSNKDSFYFK